jgi:hypothetical protein
MGVLTASGLSSKQSYQAFVALYTCLEELDLSCKLPYLNLKLLELGNKVAAPNTAALGLICNKSANNYKYFTISHYDRPQATEGRLEKKSIMLTILIPQTTNMAIKQCGEFIIVKKD